MDQQQKAQTQVVNEVDIVDVSQDHMQALIFPPNYKKQFKFKGKVKSISSFNSEGPFDVLPMHENFVTMINQKVVMVDEAGNKREFALEKALLEASNNIVKIFIEF